MDYDDGGSGDEFSEDEMYEFDDEVEVDGKGKGDEAAMLKAKLEAKKKADDLLFDINEDEKTEKWVDKHMRGGKSSSKGGRKTDAVLSCPCCFTPLCYDCQQHDSYKNQYRAMFVKNCKVDTKQVLKFAQIGRGQRAKVPEPDDLDEVYNPVACTGCDTEVAVMDKDEVYHFFNVIAGDS